MKRVRRWLWTSDGRPLDVRRTSARSVVLWMEGLDAAFQELRWTQVAVAELYLRSGLRGEV